MLQELKNKLSAIFNSEMIATHMFQKNRVIDVVSEFSGRHVCYAPGLVRVWAEANPVGKDEYVVVIKRWATHDNDGVEGRSRLTVSTVKAAFDTNGRKSVFNRAEAVAVLKQLERQWERDGAFVSQKQPFRKRLYATQKAALSKAA